MMRLSSPLRAIVVACVVLGVTASGVMATSTLATRFAMPAGVWLGGLGMEGNGGRSSAPSEGEGAPLRPYSLGEQQEPASLAPDRRKIEAPAAGTPLPGAMRSDAVASNASATVSRSLVVLCVRLNC